MSNRRKLTKLKPRGAPLTPRQDNPRPVRSPASRSDLARSKELSVALPSPVSLPKPLDQNRLDTRYVRFAGDLYPLPLTEAPVWEWIDALEGDERLDDGVRQFAGMLAGTMIRAIRTGEGVVTE